MKKLCPFFLFLSFYANAQEFSSKLTRADLPKEIPNSKFDVTVKEGDLEFAGFANNIPSAVLRSFADKYEYVREVNWYVDEKEVTAAFKLDGQDLVVTYNRDGQCICTRKSYAANLLALRINNQLISEIQKGYHVTWVTEVEHELKTTYEISLQNEKKWLMIIIQRDHVDGSLDELNRNSFTKG